MVTLLSNSALFISSTTNSNASFSAVTYAYNILDEYNAGNNTGKIATTAPPNNILVDGKFFSNASILVPLNSNFNVKFMSQTNEILGVNQKQVWSG